MLELHANKTPTRSRSTVPAGIGPTGHVGDLLEQEADRAADRAVRGAVDTAGVLGPRRAVSGGVPALPTRADELRSPGWPLEPATRARLERHFGCDFSRVRVHTDTRAARSAEALGARAFTRGGDIVFAGGQYAPHTAQGERLLAHELAHVVQQATRPAPAVQFQRAPSPAAARVPKIDIDRVLDRYVVKVDGQPVAEVKTEDEKTSYRLDVNVEGDAVHVVLRHQGGAVLAAAPPPDLMSSRFQVDLREIDERPGPGPGGTTSEPGASQADPPGSAQVKVEPSSTLPWLSGQQEALGREGISLAPSAVSEYEVRLKRDPSLVNGVVYDPETGELIGYSRSSGGVTSFFDREGGLQAMDEIGIEQPLLDPIDLIPTPGEAVKVSAGIAGKLGVKALTKKAAAQGTRLSMAAILRMRGVSRVLLRRAAREVAAESAGLVRRITVDGLNHSFDRHAAQWFGREVSRATHFAPWRALIERGAASKSVFAWSTGAAETIAHLSYIEGKPFVVQFFRETGELATAFVPNSDQLEAMLRMLGRAR